MEKSELEENKDSQLSAQVPSTGNQQIADNSIIGQYNNPEAIDDLDMMAGYDSEDYGNEFVDLGDLQQELGEFGSGMPKTVPQTNLAQPKDNIYDKYANFDDEDDFADNFDDDIFNDMGNMEAPNDKFNQLSGSLKGISKMAEQADLNEEEEGVPLDQFLESMRNQEEPSAQPSQKHAPTNNLQFDDDMLDLQGPNSDDEDMDNFTAIAGSDIILDSPIRDDAYEGKVEDEEEDPSLKPIQVVDENEQEPDFSKMNNLSLMGGQKQPNQKDIDIRKGISIEKGAKGQNQPGQKGEKKQDFNIIQHSQSHFDGVKGMVLEKAPKSKMGAGALQSFANAGGVSHLKADGFNSDDEDFEDSDDGELFEFNPPEDIDSTWHTSDQFERWIIIEGVSATPQNLVSQSCNPQALQQNYKKLQLEFTKNHTKQREEAELLKMEEKQQLLSDLQSKFEKEEEMKVGAIQLEEAQPDSKIKQKDQKIDHKEEEPEKIDPKSEEKESDDDYEDDFEDELMESTEIQENIDLDDIREDIIEEPPKIDDPDQWDITQSVVPETPPKVVEKVKKVDSDEEALLEAKELHQTISDSKMKDIDFGNLDDKGGKEAEGNKENEMRRSNEAKPAVAEIQPLQEKPKPSFGKKKLNKADYMFKAKKDQMLVKMPGDINGIDFMIKDLDNCTVMLLDHTAQITVDRCNNTKFYIGPIKSSIFFRDCQDCEITVSCSQFRCRDLNNSKLWLYTPNDPIVESSSNLIIAPYNFKYPNLKEHVDKAQLIGEFTDDDGIIQQKVNKWSQIYDFTKQEDETLNYQILQPKDFKVIDYLFVNNKLNIQGQEGLEDKDYLFELNVDYGGSLSNEVVKAADSLMAFDIRTGAQAAQEAFDKKQEQAQALLIPGPDEVTKAQELLKEKPAENPPIPASSISKKKKLNKADFMFKAQKDQMLVKMPGDINGIDFMIKDLENCTVMLLDHSAQITVDRCKNTKFYIGPIKASIFFRDCSDCEITVSCSQFRCRDLKNSKLWLYTPNDPIVESSSDLMFAPYNFKYPYLKEHVNKAELIGEFTDDDGIVQKKVNKWSQIYDFTKREDETLNFKLLDPSSFQIIDYKSINDSLNLLQDNLQDMDYLYELNIDYGGSLSNEVIKTADSLMAFDIRTGAQAAQEAFEKKEEAKALAVPGPDEITKPQELQIEKPIENTQVPAPSITKKKKLNKADFMFKAQKDQTLVKMPGDINGIDFMIKDLENCTVMLLDHTAQITVDRCKNTKFYIGPIKASIFFRDCSDCEITVSCSQFRCRDLINSKLWLYTPNDPIVESSSGLIIAPYNFKYPYLKEHVDKAQLIGEFTDDDGVVQKKVNKWSQIYDFTKREDEQLNFKLLDPSEFKIINYKLIDLNVNIVQDQSIQDIDYLFELNVDYGGSLSNDVIKAADSLMAFDIRTGAQAAQEAFQKKEEQAQAQLIQGPDEVTKPIELQKEKAIKISESDKSPVQTTSIAKKKKLNKADFMFKQQKDQMLVKMPGDINGIDFMIKDLENCTVMLLDHTAQITVDRCKNTKFYIGPIKASIFFRDCSDCEITVSCSQFRCRDLKNSKLWLYTPNDPIVESSSDLIFAPYNFKYPLLRQHVDKAELIGEFTDDDGVVQKKVNKWSQIYDFTKREDDALNFKLLDPSEFKIINCNSVNDKLQMNDDVTDEEKDYLYELNVDYGGSLSNEVVKAADSLMAFDIKTGAKAAQEAFQNKEQQDQALLIPGPDEVTKPLELLKEKPAENPPIPASSISKKKKLNKADFMFKAQKDQMLVKMPGDINGIDFMIKDLENCTVMLLDHTAQITVDRCKNTKFYIGPIKASIFFRDCSDCEITVSCSQFRCRDLNNSKLWLYTPNDPIVESSSNLIIAPYNFKYPNLKEHVDMAQLIGEFTDDDGVVQKKVNKWSQIYDFTKREDETLNFKLLDPSEFKLIDYKYINQNLNLSKDNLQDVDFIYELNVDYGGSLSNEVVRAADSLMAFDIRTGAQAAQEAFQKKEYKALLIPGPDEVTKPFEIQQKKPVESIDQVENIQIIETNASTEPQVPTASITKKKKLNKADYMFKAQKDQMLVKMPGDINGIDFMIKDLENCTVMLLDHTAQITVDRCKNTKFYIGPIKASIFFRDCSDCEITVSCSQFRCRDLTNSKLWLYTPNDPIVESSSDLIFAPYNFKYPQLKDHVDKAELIGEFTDDDGVTQKKVNKWSQIFDFTKREDEQLNFKLLDPQKFQIINYKIINESLNLDQQSAQNVDYLYQLNVDYGGSISNETTKAADSLMAFDIRTGAQAAQEAFQKKEEAKALAVPGPSEVTKPLEKIQMLNQPLHSQSSPNLKHEDSMKPEPKDEDIDMIDNLFDQMKRPEERIENQKKLVLPASVINFNSLGKKLVIKNLKKSDKPNAKSSLTLDPSLVSAAPVSQRAQSVNKGSAKQLLANFKNQNINFYQQSDATSPKSLLQSDIKQKLGQNMMKKFKLRRSSSKANPPQNVVSNNYVSAPVPGSTDDKKQEFENVYKNSGGGDQSKVFTRKSLLLQQQLGKKIKLKLKRAPSVKKEEKDVKEEKNDKGVNPYEDAK